MLNQTFDRFSVLNEGIKEMTALAEKNKIEIICLYQVRY